MLKKSLLNLFFLSIFTWLAAACTPTASPAIKDNSTQKEISVNTEGVDFLSDDPDAILSEEIREESPFPSEYEEQPEIIDPFTHATTRASDHHITIAYLDGKHDIWLWREGQESATKLTDSGNIQEIWLKNDGSAVAFTRREDIYRSSLWYVQSDGQNEKLLVKADDFQKMLAPEYKDAYGANPASVKWVANTSILAFNTYPILDVGSVLNDDLWLVDTDTAEIRSVIEPGGGGEFLFSPDFKQIAIIKHDRICLVNADGSNRRSGVVRFDPIMTNSEWVYYPAPVWSPDSSFLHVAIPSDQGLNNTQQLLSTWDIPTDGSQGIQTGELTIAAYSWWVDYSPDLSKILYRGSATDNAEGLDTLEVSDSNGNNRLLFSTGTISDFGWLPDSQHFYYVLSDTGEAYIASTESESQVELLSELKNIVRIRWINEKDYLLLQETENAWNLYLVQSGKEDLEIGMIEKNNSDYSQLPIFTFSN